jgi:hypothetical protein
LITVFDPSMEGANMSNIATLFAPHFKTNPSLCYLQGLDVNIDRFTNDLTLAV